MASTSAQALRFSALTLVNNAKKEGKRVFLWTFTFVDAIPPKIATKTWDRFLKRLLRRYPDLGGVRVYELHPGWREGQEERSHGIHVHVVTDQYLDVTKVRETAIGLYATSDLTLKIGSGTTGGTTWLGEFVAKAAPAIGEATTTSIKGLSLKWVWVGLGAALLALAFILFQAPAIGKKAASAISHAPNVLENKVLEKPSDSEKVREKSEKAYDRVSGVYTSGADTFVCLERANKRSSWRKVVGRYDKYSFVVDDGTRVFDVDMP